MLLKRANIGILLFGVRDDHHAAGVFGTGEKNHALQVSKKMVKGLILSVKTLKLNYRKIIVYEKVILLFRFVLIRFHFIDAVVWL